jgi:hypothetical protein
VAAAKDEDTRIKLFAGVASPTGKPLAEWTARELYSAVPGDLGGLGKVLHRISSSAAGECKGPQDVRACVRVCMPA